jgi:hypothetical protein
LLQEALAAAVLDQVKVFPGAAERAVIAQLLD